MTPRKPHRRASGGTAPSPLPERKEELPPALAAKAAEDDPRVWGDEPEDRDSWLQEQQPPHWH